MSNRVSPPDRPLAPRDPRTGRRPAAGVLALLHAADNDSMQKLLQKLRQLLSTSVDLVGSLTSDLVTLHSFEGARPGSTTIADSSSPRSSTVEGSSPRLRRSGASRNIIG